MHCVHPLRLECPVQHYAWGRSARDSIIPRLLQGAQAAEELPYAELWMGAHPSAPSRVKFAQEELSLSELINRFPEEILGSEVSRQFAGELPFLFKVLSVRTALSIQAHPDKALAGRLHRGDPLRYPDENHKPEIAIALTPVQLLYGFRTPDIIRRHLESVPELALLAGEEVVCSFRKEDAGSAEIGELMRAVMLQEPDAISSASTLLYNRLAQKNNLSVEEEWILRLSADFPDGDPGLFSFFVQNLETIVAEEAVFIGPNIPHAYLEGELVECMANSDNVIRAGLTPKFRDVSTLLEMTDFDEGRPKLIRPIPKGPETGWRTYPAPVEEFRIDRFDGRVSDFTCATEGKIQLLFCLEGRGEVTVECEQTPLAAGDALIMPAVLKNYHFSLEQGTVFLVSIP